MTCTGYEISPDMERRHVTVRQRDASGKLAGTDFVSRQNPPVKNGGAASIRPPGTISGSRG